MMDFTLLLLSLLAIYSVKSHPLSSEDFLRDSYLDFDNDFQMLWNYNETHILIQLRVNTQGWVGIGFSKDGSMKDADIHVGWVKNGRSYLTDRFGPSYGNGYPQLDTDQNLILLSGRECDGTTIITFLRQLVGCQPHEDGSISSNTMRVIYAYGKSDPAGDDLAAGDIHEFKNRGTRSLLLLQPSVNTPIQEANTSFFDFKMDGELIPTQNTYYHCRIIQMPKLNSIKHIIRFEPIINETYVKNVHHILVHLCNESDVNPELINTSYECYTSGAPYCSNIFAAWAIGGEEMSLPDFTGLPIGEEGQSRTFLIEMHYDNPELIEIRDNSGIRVVYTSNLREIECGLMRVEHIVSGFYMAIPPNLEKFNSRGSCGSRCIGGAMKIGGVTSFNITHVFLHSHLAGRKLKLRHFRNGIELPYVIDDESYDFDFQQPHLIQPLRNVQMGDELMVECTYTTKGRKEPLFGGLDTEKEMCMAFFWYYPRIPLHLCSSATASTPTILNKMLGIKKTENINMEKGIFRRDLNDRIVTSPADKTGSTVAQLMKEYDWTTEKVKDFEDNLNSNYLMQVCLSHSPVQTLSFIPPIKIDQVYEKPNENKQCIKPSGGFATKQDADTCDGLN